MNLLIGDASVAIYFTSLLVRERGAGKYILQNGHASINVTVSKMSG